LQVSTLSQRILYRYSVNQRTFLPFRTSAHSGNAAAYNHQNDSGEQSEKNVNRPAATLLLIISGRASK